MLVKQTELPELLHFFSDYFRDLVLQACIENTL
jgi:hypothetical protein